MKFTLRHGKHQKNPSTAQAPNQQIQLEAAAMPVTSPNVASEFEYVLVTPSRNSVTIFNKVGEILTSSPMDRSAFKDISETVELLGPNPTVETVDCKAIGNAILDHYERWYSGIKKDGSTDEDIVDLLKEMMIYALRNYPMVMASPVAGPEVIDMIYFNVLDRIADAHDD